RRPRPRRKCPPCRRRCATTGSPSAPRRSSSPSWRSSIRTIICGTSRVIHTCSPISSPMSAAVTRSSLRCTSRPGRCTGPSGPPGLLLDKSFREGFAALVALDLTFDVWMFQTQLGDLADLAKAFPQARIVLNHVGGPVAIGSYAGKRDEAFAAWRSGIQQIAGFPNTYVKLGGLGMKMIGFDFFNNPEPPSSQDLEKAWRPYVDT